MLNLWLKISLGLTVPENGSVLLASVVCQSRVDARSLRQQPGPNVLGQDGLDPHSHVEVHLKKVGTNFVKKGILLKEKSKLEDVPASRATDRTPRT